MKRTIRITGNAVVNAPANTTVVRAEIEGLEETFEDAVESLTKATRHIKDSISKLGIQRDSIKTSQLSIKAHYRKVKKGVDEDKKPIYVDKFDGYAFSQNISFRFPNDNEKLTAAVKRIYDVRASVKVYFSFVNDDPERMYREALVRATEKAKTEAEAIVSAAGSKLGRLVDVKKGSDYYDGDYCRKSYSAPMVMGKPLDIDPEDDSASQSITLTWTIED
ncbi:hypothetical protein TALC_01414 [Thermoplasmatales archaeon BRNA1]|nr:hypothetical protein TALC_01414 [Thermoplasmatales archaeon BRNA1]